MLSNGVSSAPAPPAAPPATARRGGFHLLLSELNPLQYLPVIGTLYRAVTGDTIPQTARMVGSFVVSGLLGGPVGLLTSAIEVGVERLTGLDPEKIGRTVLADLGIGRPQTPAAAATAAPPARPWSPAQLAAYGVTTAADGTVRSAGLQGADALNALELARLSPGSGVA